ncbi:MAG: MurR/RpiR family transcriptional regulator [Eubacteriales bacterium]|nr:MurR/RpiR family transcriptional regulator [Oscillospiraceae bacterium]MDD3833087.1 MurR/RpiR family transcriptional regulator [Oscillospiraceae bacterium]MDD4495434.1 MurR/RpiR family transcriptional regulator [Eubacteriales bacterium]
MESVLLKIRNLYPEMGRGEKKIADWILAHPHDIISMSISDFAAICGCGDATVFRFSKRLGLVGYQALKIAIAQETSSYNADTASIEKTDDCITIFLKRTKDIIQALETTKSVLSQKELKNAADAIITAKRIAIFGLGNSASVAMDAQHKFMRAGLNTTAYCDNHLQAIAASHLTKDDVAIGISHSGSSVDIVDALRLASQSGATTICLTNIGSSPIEKYSDVRLYTKAEETKYTILAMCSRISQLAIIDAIYTYIIYNADETAAEAIRETERALQSKKY